MKKDLVLILDWHILAIEKLLKGLLMTMTLDHAQHLIWRNTLFWAKQNMA